jgi:transcriptional regulator with XRE-family HTH domain
MIIDMRASLSESLKARRLQLGLSLSRLAKRVRTSAATVFRYESGWHRFELYTLQKLAAALGCRLRIELEPLDGGSGDYSIARIRRLFWDKPLEEEDFFRYPRWIVRRVLEFGTLEDVRALIGRMGKGRFLQEVGAIRFGAEKTRTFWRMMLEYEGIKCTLEPCPRAAEISWRG